MARFARRDVADPTQMLIIHCTQFSLAALGGLFSAGLLDRVNGCADLCRATANWISAPNLV